MTAKDVILFSMGMSDNVFNAYLGDLSDADLLVRPAPGMNHIAWQIGHLISSERQMVEGIQPGSCPPLPEGFEEGHGRETFNVDDPAKYYSKDRYVELYNAQRAATKQVLETADLDAPGPERMRNFAPTVGAIFELQGGHVLMHVGQWVAVRRQAGKPVVI